MSLFRFLLPDTSSRRTPPPPPGDPSGGVVYLRIVLSPEEASRPVSNYQHGLFYRRGIVSISSNLQARGPPLVGCPRLFIQFIHSYPPHRRPFLHPQPEDAPCRGDKDPHMCNGYGILTHWSRYWLGHPHTFSTVKFGLTYHNHYTYLWLYAAVCAPEDGCKQHPKHVEQKYRGIKIHINPCTSSWTLNRTYTSTYLSRL
jgi:hypothetical protein